MTAEDTSLSDYLLLREAQELMEGGVTAADLDRHQWYNYTPHTQGQRQFHEAKHIIRLLAPGNGWGKSCALSVEIAYWIGHCHPFQETPEWPVQVFLVIRKFDQWEKVRGVWEQWWPAGWVYNTQKKTYQWPSGDKIHLITDETDWTSEQGSNPDLIVIDETCPSALWRELRMRRRGAKQTRFCIGATQTEGLTWMYSELYVPWLEAHKTLGMGEAEAHRAQSHRYPGMKTPGVFVWCSGGIQDNPTAKSEDLAFYQSANFASEAERAVRLGGGFRDFAGTPVFRLDRLEEQEPREGTSGNLSDDWVCDREGVWNAGPSVKWHAGESVEGGKVVMFELPQPQERYVVVFDAALGIEGKDLDFVHVLNRYGQQVAKAEGRWSNSTGPGLTRIAARMHYFFNGAFTGAERQVGLVHLRELWDKFGVCYQYRSRKEEEGGRRRQDALGHARTHNDMAMGLLRGMLAEPKATRQLHIWDAETLRQLKRYQFKSRRASVDVSMARDADLTMGAPEGDHDDAVTSLAVGALMLREIPFFEAERPKFAAGTYGALVQADLDKLHGVEEVADADPFA
jgi:hypothetical protein